MRDLQKLVEQTCADSRVQLIERLLINLIIEAREAILETHGNPGVNLLPAVSLDADGAVRFVVKAIDVNATTGPREASSGMVSSLYCAAGRAIGNLASKAEVRV